MPDIRLSAVDDLYVQSAADKDQWNTVYGEGGNDTLRLYRGTALGGPGNDRIERLADASINPLDLSVAFYGAGDNLKVNLAEGWAEDGEGGRDTLVGLRNVQGSGARNAWVLGDDNDNTYATNGGDDVFIGAGGTDTVWVTGHFRSSQSAPWIAVTQAHLTIQTSPDGRHTTLRTTGGGDDVVVQTTDVEFAQVQSATQPNQWLRVALADHITPLSMAEAAIAAGGAQRWNAHLPLGSATSLSFSFVSTAPAAGVGANGFRAFSDAERSVVREILNQTAQLTQLNFNEVDESAGAPGQLRFGVSQQAATKGQSGLPGSAGEQAGDVWMDVESMPGLVPGSEGWQALLHEIGHALGLRHPRNADAADAWAMQLRAADDRLDLSVMSQNPAPDGLFRSDWGPLDVLALRHLYGRRDAGLGDTLYPLTGDSRSQRTLVDDGGIDTLDASSLGTSVRLDLREALGSNVGLTPGGLGAVRNLSLVGAQAFENAVGSAHNDELIGNAGANLLSGGLGNDWLDGGAGLDRAAFSGSRADFTITRELEHWIVSARDGSSGADTLVAVERAMFSDRAVAFDLDGAAGAVAQILRALLGPAALKNALYAGIGLSLFDRGMPYAEVVQLALGTADFEAQAGGRSHTAFVNTVYRNVVGVAPSAADLAHFTGLLESGQHSQATLAMLACQVDVNARSADLVGLASTGLEFLPHGG